MACHYSFKERYHGGCADTRTKKKEYAAYPFKGYQD